MLLEIDTNVYVNPDQVEIIRPATPFEKLDRVEKCTPECTAIIFQTDRFYVKGYPNEIMRKLYPDKNEKELKAR